jgi:hypothetical protein
MTRDDWRSTLNDGAWKRVTLQHIAGLGQRIWIRCNGCGHEHIAEPPESSPFGMYSTARELQK